jgi:hypothetical protein
LEKFWEIGFKNYNIFINKNIMKKIIRLTEGDLIKLVKRVISEQDSNKPRGCTGNPNAINVITINVYLSKTIYDNNGLYLSNILFESLEDYSNSSPYNIAIEFSKDVQLNQTQRLFQFQIEPTYKNSLRQAGWVDNYFKGFTTILSDTMLKIGGLDSNYFKLIGPQLNWGAYFESEPTNCPDLCIGAAYRIDYTPPK